MKKIFVYFLIILFFNTSLFADNLAEALLKAYNKNPKLNAERENINISQEDINISKSNFLPTITISGYKSSENTSKLTDRGGVDTSKEDVNPLQKSLLVEQKLYDQSIKPDLEKNVITEYYQRCFGEDLPESSVNIKI